ncbi:hypothetical protein PISMIDRAFT_680590, partial [Pisolithus microcarpus 441]
VSKPASFRSPPFFDNGSSELGRVAFVAGKVQTLAPCRTSTRLGTTRRGSCSVSMDLRILSLSPL